MYKLKKLEINRRHPQSSYYIYYTMQ